MTIGMATRPTVHAPEDIKGEGATLVLRIEGPRAIEVQHRAAQILERINAYFGYRAVTDMRFLQAPIARVARPKTHAEPPASRLRPAKIGRHSACGLGPGAGQVGRERHKRRLGQDSPPARRAVESRLEQV